MLMLMQVYLGLCVAMENLTKKLNEISQDKRQGVEVSTSNIVEVAKVNFPTCMYLSCVMKFFV